MKLQIILHNGKSATLTSGSIDGVIRFLKDENYIKKTTDIDRIIIKS